MFKVGDVVKFYSQKLVFSDSGSVLTSNYIVGRYGLIVGRSENAEGYGYFKVKVSGRPYLVTVWNAEKSLREVRNKIKAFNVKLELSDDL